MTPVQTDDWIYATLLRLADPLGPSDVSWLQEVSADTLRRLLAISRIHGVLGIVLEKLRGIQSLFPAIWDTAHRCRQAEIVKSLRIRHHAYKILKLFDASGVPAAILKGPDFADALYPNPSLRSTLDVDLLIPLERWTDAALVLLATGHSVKCDQFPMDLPGGRRGEQTWLHHTASTTEVDLHWNLIDLPSHREHASLEFADLPWHWPRSLYATVGHLTPASRLVIAGVHATYHHQFDRLILLIDLLQACRQMRTDADIQEASGLLDRTHTRQAVDMGLLIAGHLIGEGVLEQVRQRLAGCAGRLSASAVSASFLADARLTLCTLKSDANFLPRSRIRHWLRSAS